MPKLKEIFSGLANDIVQLQVASDEATMETLKRYQSDNSSEELKFLDIPRFTVSDLNINMKFAIEDMTEATRVSETEIKKVNEEWNKVVIDKIIKSNVLKSNLLDAASLKFIKLDLTKKTTFLKKEKVAVTNVFSDAQNNVIDKTTTFVNNYFSQLNNDKIKELSKTPAFNKTVANAILTTYKAELPKLQKQVIENSVVERELEVIVNNKDLEKIDNSQIHEVSFKLIPDFIKIVNETTP